MPRRNGDNTGHRCRVTLVEIAAFGADAKRAAEKLGVTVGGHRANRPGGATEDAAAVPQLGLELVEEQVTHDPDRKSRLPAGRGHRPSVNRTWEGEVE
jgi:hypothetical protein